MTSDRAAVVRANETSIVWGRSSSRKLWAVRNSRRRRDARFFTRQLVEQAGRHRAAGGVLPNDYGKQYFHIEHPAPVSASVMTGMERVHVGRMNDRPSHPRTRPARAPGCGRGAPDLLVGSCRAQAPGRHLAVGYDPPQAPAAALAVLRRSRPTATMHDRTRSPRAEPHDRRTCRRDRSLVPRRPAHRHLLDRPPRRRTQCGSGRRSSGQGGHEDGDDGGRNAEQTSSRMHDYRSRASTSRPRAMAVTPR